ncbi:DUF378 domain-containing protein [Clostridium sp. Sa3CUN1]|uniref:DUF378 domain-containing protein n=1 Tax=Clostridium gallinarum TaxID=2762246 RepID=A0ABR8Q142_9CLOT|nr:DUF378 domain-containing protein [Clostridium gallinarum]MBD7914064.1 DUF378 domain-containing protein [Clostridium gallinarum]
MKVLDSIVLILVIVGAVNWGLIGFFQYNLVNGLFGSMPALERIIYALVGIAGLYSISFFAKSKYASYND